MEPPGRPNWPPITRRPASPYPVSTISPGVVVYSYSTPAPTTSFTPSPPHIVHPSLPPSRVIHNNFSTDTIIGIALGGATFIAILAGTIFYLCRRKRLSGQQKKKKIGCGWKDLESEDAFDLASLPSYDEMKSPELKTSSHYTKYSARTQGRLSPVSQTLPPTFNLIKEHHSSCDPFTDPNPSSAARPPCSEMGQKTLDDSP
ncbi:hypothetical protein H0H93_008607 [Arthromyces matolae]|nr:hypothetical protein H0H93_008607 [Arthromyces matolae]